VTLINAFSVADGESDSFLRRWKESARIMSCRPGLIGARMYCALADQADPRFVNVAEWENREALDSATANPEWQASVRRMFDDPDLHLTVRPVLCQVAITLRPGEGPS
jgi:heme-degrading monooxygenase HmoA